MTHAPFRRLIVTLGLSSSALLAGCEPDGGGVDRTSFAIEGLTIERLSTTPEQPPTFFATFQFANRSSGSRADLVTFATFEGDGFSAKYAVDLGARSDDGTCPQLPRNGVFDVAPGEAKEVRLRVALPPSPSPALETSCVTEYPGPGFASGVKSAFMESSGTVDGAYLSTMKLTLELGSPGVAYEASASTKVVVARVP